MKKWEEFLYKFKHPESEVRIGLIGKYVELRDAYKSIAEAFIHGGAVNKTKVKIEWIHSESMVAEAVEEKLKDLDGVLVAPGFGERGIEGKIAAVKYVRENNIPFLGICLGMQMAVIEYARNVLGWENAHSTEMEKTTEYPVIDLMADQQNIENKGGTMRLGAYNCKLSEKSLAKKIYGKSKISERHRHRWEFNNKFRADFEKAGLFIGGTNPENDLVEIIEIPKNRFFIGVQYHPELKSTVLQPHPLFVSFVKASLDYKTSKK
jgi:CTP synthase